MNPGRNTLPFTRIVGASASFPAPELQVAVSAAEGYITLDLLVDAWNELENLPDYLRGEETVLALRIEIFRKYGRWDFARQLAESLTKNFPVNPRWWIEWAISLEKEKTPDAAHAVLEEAVELHPKNAMIQYHLARLSSLLGLPNESSRYLATAIRLEPSLRGRALVDPDFRQHLASSL